MVTPEAYLSLLGEVPEFPSKLATMRKYNISASIVLQDTAQIEAMYKDNAKTLVGNCSTYIFLGTQQPDTLKYFSEMLGKMTIRTKSTGMSNGGKSGSNANYTNTSREVMTADELGRMPSDECIVYTQNMRPVRDKKYDYTKHPYYPQTADADGGKENAYKYMEMSIYDTTRIGASESILRASAMARRVASFQARKAETMQSASKVSVAGSAEMLDRISFGKDNDKAICRVYINECTMSILENPDDIACVLMRGIPLKMMKAIVDGASDCALDKNGFILFSDTSTRKTDINIFGISNIKGNAVLKEKIMKNPYVKIYSFEEDYILFIVEHNEFESFRESINEEKQAA